MENTSFIRFNNKNKYFTLPILSFLLYLFAYHIISTYLHTHIRIRLENRTKKVVTLICIMHGKHHPLNADTFYAKNVKLHK